MLNYGAYELIGIMGVFGSLTIFLKVSRNMGTVRQGLSEIVTARLQL